MSSTFKNCLPRRKYRERGQPEGREHLGILEKKKDYKERANNYHRKQDQLNLLKSKAHLKNKEEFYFKMLKGKRNEEGKFVEESDSDSDFDEKEYRSALKTQNFSIVQYQRSMVIGKIQKLKGDLHMLSAPKTNQQTIYLDDEQELNNFEAHKYFNTTKELAQNNLLEVNPKTLEKQDNEEIANEPSPALKSKYTRLGEYLEKQRKLTKLLLKIGYEKNLQSKDRSMIKKIKGKKIHKFFMSRKK